MFEFKTPAMLRFSEGKELAHFAERKQLRGFQAAKVHKIERNTKKKTIFLFFSSTPSHLSFIQIVSLTHSNSSDDSFE